MEKVARNIYQSLTESYASKRLFQLILGIALTTWIHHAYGGWVYDTSWRILIPSVTIPFLLTLTFYLQYLLLNKKRKCLQFIFISLVSIFWILSIGLIEGGYNHVLKNILYFSDFPKEKLAMMFPPEFGDQSFFELPSDFFFEATGIIQLFIAVAIMYYLHKFIKDIQKLK